jgi:hypothetical protein
MMQIDGGKTAFLPGETVRGGVSWESARPVRRAELRLIWYTSGRGTRDMGVVEVQQLPPASPASPIPFTFALPAGPYSFSGQLITLNWAVELVLSPGSIAERVEFAVSPDGKPIVLGSPDPLDQPNDPAIIAR